MMIKVNGRMIEGLVQTRINDTAWEGRESKAITIETTYAEAQETFVNDVPWSIISNDENTFTERETDMSEYAISGPITDNRNGTITVRMGKYRESELMCIPLKEAPKDHKDAMLLREIIEEAVQSIEEDDKSIIAISLHPLWETLASKAMDATIGFRFQHEGKLYKVLSAHTFSMNYVPGIGTESLYARIDESHEGTESDPIPYDGNMELFEGVYYVQNGVTYLCNRSTGAPVYNELAHLIDIYVQVVG